MNTLYTVGIGGGSGSGKSTIAKALRTSAGEDQATILKLDWYFSFKGSAPVSRADHAEANLDHPRHLDWERALRDIKSLQNGTSITPPTHHIMENGSPLEQSTTELQPSTFLIVEGLHALTFPELVDLYDFRVFVQTPQNVRIKRRLARDPERTGQSPDQIRDQIEVSVLPMHEEHIEPASLDADLVVDGTQDPELLARQIRQEVLST